MELILLELAVLFTVCIAAAGLRMAWRSPSVSRALTVMLALYFTLWHLLPICLSVALWDKLNIHSVAETDFLRVAAIETGVFAAIVGCFPLWQGPSAMVQKLAIYSFRPTPSTVLGAGIAACLMTAYLHFSTDFGTSYLERTAFAVTATGTDAFNRSGSIVFLSQIAMVIVYAALVTRYEPKIPKWLTAFLVGVVFFWIYTQVAEGSRMAMLVPVILLILYTVFNKWSRRRVWITFAILGPALAVVVGLVTIAVEITRAKEANALGGASEVVNFALATPDAASRLAITMGNSLVFKLDSFSTGALLLQAYGSDDAGFAPYAGAVLAGVPRILYENKPVPGSRDGTYAGDPGRLVAVLLGMDPNSGSAGIGMASISIWQLGYCGGLVLLILANVINLKVLNTLFLSPSLLGRATALMVIGAPSLAGMLATPDVILMNLQRLLLLLFLFSSAAWLLDKRAWSAGALSAQFLSRTPSTLCTKPTSATRLDA